MMLSVPFENTSTESVLWNRTAPQPRRGQRSKELSRTSVAVTASTTRICSCCTPFLLGLPRWAIMVPRPLLAHFAHCALGCLGLIHCPAYGPPSQQRHQPDPPHRSSPPQHANRSQPWPRWWTCSPSRSADAMLALPPTPSGRHPQSAAPSPRRLHRCGSSFPSVPHPRYIPRSRPQGLDQRAVARPHRQGAIPPACKCPGKPRTSAERGVAVSERLRDWHSHLRSPCIRESGSQ